MAELLSVGLDVGTTSTQMVVSRLTVENRAGPFSVPELQIGAREIRYRSPVHFTPLLGENLVDGEGLRALVEREYAAAGVGREDVDTGAVIITGETSRRENARTVTEALAELAGDFVVAAAGPDLESVLAAKGAGAVAHSERTGQTVLHFDIGGGTANMALIRQGRVAATGCLNVGGRLVKIGENGRITYISPVLKGLFHARVGDTADRAALTELAERLAGVLEMAAGLRPADEWLRRLRTAEAGDLVPPGEPVVYSFSGGVADCIRQDTDWLAYGDIGPLLGGAIRRSRLCRGAYMLGEETIRATVIGAGSHSAQLSGSTVFHQNITFPLKNLPVVTRPGAADGPEVLAVGGAGDYREVRALAERIAGTAREPLIVAAQQDMAKALGVQLALRLGPGAKILCIDRVRLGEGDYLDVGAPIGPALPVVVKTLVMGK